MNLKNKMKSDEGNILIMSVVIMGLLVATGMAYMQWSADEGRDSQFEEATVQAYFLGQLGVIEQGLRYLRNSEPSDLPTGKVLLPSKRKELIGRKITRKRNGEFEYYGGYTNTSLTRVIGLGEGSVFQRSDTYDITSTGEVFFNSHMDPNKEIVVQRTATMRARLRSFANYMYLTHWEITRFNEIIWFWTPDTLYGRTHSNDFIGMKFSPQFYGPISSSQGEFRELDASPYFAHDPVFNVPKVYFPTQATAIRGNAAPFVDTDNGRWMITIELTDGTANITRYPMGGDPADREHVTTVGPLIWNAIFVDGQCEVYGVLSGNLTIGSAGDMWLINNISYPNADRLGIWDDDGDPGGMLGLVSESNIIIRDNWANGKGNMVGGESIIINAGMVALGESFTFQHQNDDWDLYQGPEPDERGYIRLKGAVTQWRRGYVHRSNHMGTGYGKSYNYDFRFDERPPPFYLEAMDENGHGLFDIISWGEKDAVKGSSGEHR